MKFSAVVFSVAIAATSTSAFTAPLRVNRGSSMLFSSEMKETAPTTTTTTEEEDVPGTIDAAEFKSSSSSSSSSPTLTTKSSPSSPILEKDMKKFEEKVAETTKVELQAAVAAPPKAEPVPVPVVAEPVAVVASTIPDKSRILAGRYDSIPESLAIPFLKRPTKLDGTHAGDFGFDPLGLSEEFDLYAMQESEIRHARLAMLAVIGWPMSELLAPEWMLRANGCAPSVLNGFNPVSFLSVVAAFGAIGFFEYKTSLRRNCDTPFGKMHRADMEDTWKFGVAGDYGFDPLNLYSSIGDNAYARKGLREVEISHGRSAMLGITAFAAWEAITGNAITDSASMFFTPNVALPALYASYLAFGYFYEREESDTYIRWKMSSEGQARWENLKIGLNMNSAPAVVEAGAGSAGLPDFDMITEFPEKAAAFFDGIQDKYNNLEKTYMDKIVGKKDE